MVCMPRYRFGTSGCAPDTRLSGAFQEALYVATQTLILQGYLQTAIDLPCRFACISSGVLTIKQNRSKLGLNHKPEKTQAGFVLTDGTKEKANLVLRTTGERIVRGFAWSGRRMVVEF